jgi:hypothetical protein
MKKITLIILSLVILTAGCSKANRITSPMPLAEVNGKVSPAVQASVSVSKDNSKNWEGTTNSQGEFYITNLTSGSYNLAVSADGYEPANQSLDVKEGEIRSVEISLVSLANKPKAQLTTSLTVDKYSFGQGDIVNLTLTVTNNSSETVKIPYSDSSGLYFSVTDSNNKEVWNSKYGLFFLCIAGDKPMSPGAILTASSIWNGKDNNGNIVPSGEYILTGFVSEWYISKDGQDNVKITIK